MSIVDTELAPWNSYLNFSNYIHSTDDVTKNNMFAIQPIDKNVKWIMERSNEIRHNVGIT